MKETLPSKDLTNQIYDIIHNKSEWDAAELDMDKAKAIVKLVENL